MAFEWNNPKHQRRLAGLVATGSTLGATIGAAMYHGDEDAAKKIAKSALHLGIAYPIGLKLHPQMRRIMFPSSRKSKSKT